MEKSKLTKELEVLIKKAKKEVLDVEEILFHKNRTVRALNFKLMRELKNG